MHNKNMSCCWERAGCTYLFAVSNGTLLLIPVCFDVVKVDLRFKNVSNSARYVFNLLVRWHQHLWCKMWGVLEDRVSVGWNVVKSYSCGAMAHPVHFSRHFSCLATIHSVTDRHMIVSCQ